MIIPKFNAAKKALLIRIQNSRLILEPILSWLYVNREYSKSLSKKAIYDSDSFSNIVNLGQLAMEDDEVEAAN
jgi:hypothetical protein